MDSQLIETMNRARHVGPNRGWYNGYVGQRTSLPQQLPLLNLRPFFHGTHGGAENFNATLHAGEVRSYIVLALALNNQALAALGQQGSTNRE